MSRHWLTFSVVTRLDPSRDFRGGSIWGYKKSTESPGQARGGRSRRQEVLQRAQSRPALEAEAGRKAAPPGPAGTRHCIEAVVAETIRMTEVDRSARWGDEDLGIIREGRRAALHIAAV